MSGWLPKLQAPGHSLQVDESSSSALAYTPVGVAASDVDAAAEAAFAVVYQEHFDFVWKTIAGLAAGSFISVDDAVQDLWLTVARKLPDFRGECSHRTWLFAVARNVVRNHRRQWIRKGGLEPLEEASTLAAEQPDADEALRARAVWRDVQLFLSTLEEDSREVFLCRFLLEMTPREVAESTGSSFIAIYAQTRRLKAAFKRWYQSREDSDL